MHDAILLHIVILVYVDRQIDNLCKFPTEMCSKSINCAYNLICTTFVIPLDVDLTKI